MTELNEAIVFANKVLNSINAYPDDDLATLARQFLRAREALAKAVEALEHARNQIQHPDQLIDEAIARARKEPAT